MRRLTGVLLILPLLFFCASVAHQRLLDVRKEAEEFDPHVMVPAPGVARVMTLGYGELAADLVWVRTLIYYGDGLIHHTGMPDVERLVDLMSALDPEFRHPYVWGAYATVFRLQQATQAEYRASVAILRRGVARFPDDWELAKILGERLFYDIRPDNPDDRQKLRDEGASYIEHAMHMPNAPPTVARSAAAMRTILGQKERAMRELREMILVTEDDAARKELLVRYSELSRQTGDALAAESKSFGDEWHKTLPYVPASLFILLGKPPTSGIDLKDSATPSVFN